MKLFIEKFVHDEKNCLLCTLFCGSSLKATGKMQPGVI